jgi:hypothetical protein
MGLRRTEFLDAELCKPLANVDAFLDRLALYKASGKATGESVTAASLCQFLP